MIDYKKLSNEFVVRKLNKEDISKILKLYNSNPLYFKHCPPMPTKTSIKNDMISTPRNKGLEDKYYIGFFDDEELLSVMDMIEDYPDKNTIFIGLFMMANSKSAKGLGSKIIEEALKALKAQGFKRVQLAYMKENPQSKAFWKKCRFVTSGMESKNEHGIAVFMIRELI